MIPFVALFGLNELAVRLPNALAGILTVWVLYRFVLTLFQDRRLAFAVALFLAISPWHVHFSRWSVRAILLPLFFCLSLHLFLEGLKRPRKLILSGLMFGLCLHTYSAARVFVPVFLVGLVWLYRRPLWHQRTYALIGAGVFGAILAVLFPFWIAPEGLTRAEELLEPNPLQVFYNYVSYFSPDFLFFSGDPNPRHGLRGMGHLYHLELITVAGGVWWLFRKKQRAILWLWLALYPVPAALTQADHAIRAIVGAPLFAILSGLGCLALFEAIQSEGARRWAVRGGLLAGLMSVSIFCKQYFVDYPKYSARAWDYGMQEAVEFVRDQPYQCIFSNRFYSPFYLFVLFYTSFPPEKYQSFPLASREGRWRFTPRPLDDKYLAMRIENVIVPEGQAAVLVIPPEEVETVKKQGYNWREVRSILDPSGKEAVKIVVVH